MIRNLIRQADLEAIEQVVLDGHGAKLINEQASDSKIRTFIKAVPQYMVRILNWNTFLVQSKDLCEMYVSDQDRAAARGCCEG